MEMLCPECMAPLVSSDGQTAVCTTHGGNYRILFTRFPLAAPAVNAPSPESGEVVGTAVAVAGATPAASMRCSRHPDVPAIALCVNCRAPVCQTCDFMFPGGVHLCPSCAANPRPQISPGRRKLIPWSIGLAVFSFLGLIGSVALARVVPHADVQALGAVGELFSILPALIGVALGVAAIERRLRTPGIVYIGIVGNGVILLIWFLLIIVGLTR